MRYVLNYNPISTLTNPFAEKTALNISATYHAGEDFFDIIDGLRAIYEAVNFIGLKRNDRIGHAIALGLNPKLFYKYKNFNVTLTKQDLLDNIVWLINYSLENGINIENDLYAHLNNKAYELFSYIYSDCFKDDSKYLNNFFDRYYQSYKFRGDSPLKYFNGYYKKDNDKDFILQQTAENKFISNNLRETTDFSYIHYCYLYDNKVKTVGNEKVIFKVENNLIDLICKVQSRMQYNIAQKGIAIECNPSSNILISMFDRFDNHPILSFNDIEGNSSQICVSINTDDLGVFDTCLENEYAIMARSLELIKNDKGIAKYTPEQVYGWIDKVRQMSIEQIFK